MSTTAVTRDEFDSGLDALIAAEATRDAAVTKALTDLTDAVAAGKVATPEDFSAELAKVTALQAKAAAITQAATADDPGATTLPVSTIATTATTASAPATGATDAPAS